MAIPEAVLIFDPDADTAEMYGVGLELAGFRACVASSHSEARCVLTRERFSAVIADLADRTAQGWELIQFLRTERATRDIPVVGLTGWTDPWIGRRAAELGCAALLVKPCLPDTLAAVVRESLHVP